MKSFLPIAAGIFVLVSILSWLARNVLPGWNISLSALLYGNAWLFAVSVLSFSFEIKGVRQNNAHAFFRYVYIGMILKTFLSIGAVMCYALTDRAVLTRGVVLLWLLLYIIYTGLEVSRLIRANKEKW